MSVILWWIPISIHDPIFFPFFQTWKWVFKKYFTQEERHETLLFSLWNIRPMKFMFTQKMSVSILKFLMDLTMTIHYLQFCSVTELNTKTSIEFLITFIISTKKQFSKVFCSFFSILLSLKQHFHYNFALNMLRRRYLSTWRYETCVFDVFLVASYCSRMESIWKKMKVEFEVKMRKLLTINLKLELAEASSMLLSFNRQEW